MRTTYKKTSARTKFGAFMCCLSLCSFSLTGCIDGTFLSPDNEPAANASSQAQGQGTPQASAGHQELTRLLQDARYAWDLGNMERAQNLYGKATENPLLSEGEKAEAWQRFALSASYNGRPNAALDALEKWNTAVPGAEDTLLWQDAWLTSIHNLSGAAQQSKLSALWTNNSRSGDVRAMAAMLLFGHGWSSAEILQAIPTVSAAYTKQDMLRKQNFERMTAQAVRNIADTPLLEVNRHVLTMPALAFPSQLFLLEDTRRGLGLDSASLAKASDAALFVDKALPQKIIHNGEVGPLSLNSSAKAAHSAAQKVTHLPPAPAAQNTVAQAPTSSTASPATVPVSPLASTSDNLCLVLALPAQGNVSAVSKKIRIGAETAISHFAAYGRTIDLRHVDTSQNNWTAQLQALPLNCAVVGGPVLAPNLTLAKSSGATSQRNFFAFLPTLDAGDEGIKAWRFFPSPQDQVQALIDFSQQLGITDFSSFFPANTYGTRMNTIFSNAVRAKGGTVRGEGYMGSGASVWNKAVQSLLRPQIVNGKLTSTATFGATFMPDSWNNMDGIMSSFVAHGETRQVLLGTTIWGQSLGSGPIANAEKFPMAVFPSSFNTAAIPAALQGIAQADMWTALGYDFVQLGAGLSLFTMAPPSLLNSKLPLSNGFHWTMAPISWNSAGKASQKMFLMRISPQGVVPADVKTITEIRAAAFAKTAVPAEMAETAAPATAPKL